MSRTTPRPTRPTTVEAGRSGYRRTAAAALGAVAVLVLAAVGLGRSQPPQDGAAGGGVEVAGSPEATGTATAGDVLVEGAVVALGRVPLDVTVVPSWTLTNTGAEEVRLGEPHASVIEGCCPGPLVLGDGVLAPGGSTSLEFPLQMHPGMDGPHDFAVHVPILGSPEVLELRVTGDFRG